MKTSHVCCRELYEHTFCTALFVLEIQSNANITILVTMYFKAEYQYREYYFSFTLKIEGTRGENSYTTLEEKNMPV